MSQFDPNRHHRRSIRLKGYDYTAAGAYFVTIVSHSRRCLFGEVVDGVMHRNPVGEIVAACWAAIPRHFGHIALDEWVVMPNHVHGILVFRTAGAGTRAGAVTMAGGRGEASATIPVGCPDEHWLADASPLRDTPNPAAIRPIGTRPGSVGAVIQNFKSVSARRVRAGGRGEASATIPVDCPDDHWLADASPLRRTPPEPRQRRSPANPYAGPIWQRNYYEHIIRGPDALDRIRCYIRENPLQWATDAKHRPGESP
ncbi:MAG: hypothetical protein IT332_01080 [Ardenticatenales bacterium]|nr:hypothetical protein [Ardenticatenales bacterium]